METTSINKDDVSYEPVAIRDDPEPQPLDLEAKKPAPPSREKVCPNCDATLYKEGDCPLCPCPNCGHPMADCVCPRKGYLR